MGIEVRKIEGKKATNEFIKFAWEIYKGNEYWVPPIIRELKKLLTPGKHPFYDYGTLQMFLAYKGDKIVGRIAAVNNPLFVKTQNRKVGFCGFYESFDDQEVANALLDTAKKWLLEKGYEFMQGPASPSSNYEFGLLVDGFDDSPRLLMSYNPPYYQKLFENYGFVLETELVAYELETERVLSDERIKRGTALVSKRYNITLKEIDKSKMKQEIEKVRHIYNSAWENNWGFVPLTDGELEAMADELKPIAATELILFAEIEGKTVGFGLAIPDYNAIFKSFNGKLFPFNFLKIFTQKKKIKYARVITLGILPEYQKKGIDAVLYRGLVEGAKKIGIKHGDGSWILKNNEMMTRGLKGIGGKEYKQWNVYEMPIKPVNS